MADDLKKAYRTIMGDSFPSRMEISFVEEDRRTTLVYEKVTWEIEGERRGHGCAMGRTQARKQHSIGLSTGI